MPPKNSWDAFVDRWNIFKDVDVCDSKQIKFAIEPVEEKKGEGKMEYNTMGTSTVMKIRKMIEASDGNAQIDIKGYKIPCHIDSIQSDSSRTLFGEKYDMRIVCETRMNQVVKHGGFGCDIEKVIFNKPATIVFWTDGTKTVVKADKKEKFDKEKGLAMAIAKKFLGNKGSYFNQFKKWTEENEDGKNK